LRKTEKKRCEWDTLEKFSEVVKYGQQEILKNTCKAIDKRL
jgi:hypothetical protein